MYLTHTTRADAKHIRRVGVVRPDQSKRNSLLVVGKGGELAKDARREFEISVRLRLAGVLRWRRGGLEQFVSYHFTTPTKTVRPLLMGLYLCGSGASLSIA